MIQQEEKVLGQDIIATILAQDGKHVIGHAERGKNVYRNEYTVFFSGTPKSNNI